MNGSCLFSYLGPNSKHAVENSKLIGGSLVQGTPILSGLAKIPILSETDSLISLTWSWSQERTMSITFGHPHLSKLGMKSPPGGGGEGSIVALILPPLCFLY